MLSRTVRVVHIISAAAWIATAALTAIVIFTTPHPGVVYADILCAIATLALTTGSVISYALNANIASYRIGYRQGCAEAAPYLRLVKDHA